MEWTEEWLKQYQAKRAREMGAEAPVTPSADTTKRNKYGNVKTEDGFDSRHERAAYELLRARCLEGEFIAMGRQVAFFLPGGVKYLADFVTVGPDGTVTVWDAKSEATRKDKVYCLKKRQMKECLGINIVEV